MTTLFFLPLLFIALWETNLDEDTNLYMKNLFSPTDEGDESDPNNQDPVVTNEQGRVISKVSFEDLIKTFPNTTVVSTTHS